MIDGRAPFFHADSEDYWEALIKVGVIFEIFIRKSRAVRVDDVTRCRDVFARVFRVEFEEGETFGEKIFVVGKAFESFAVKFIALYGGGVDERNRRSKLEEDANGRRIFAQNAMDFGDERMFLKGGCERFLNFLIRDVKLLTALFKGKEFEGFVD